MGRLGRSGAQGPVAIVEVLSAHGVRALRHAGRIVNVVPVGAARVVATAPHVDFACPAVELQQSGGAFQHGPVLARGTLSDAHDEFLPGGDCHALDVGAGVPLRTHGVVAPVLLDADGRLGVVAVVLGCQAPPKAARRGAAPKEAVRVVILGELDDLELLQAATARLRVVDVVGGVVCGVVEPGKVGVTGGQERQEVGKGEGGKGNVGGHDSFFRCSSCWYCSIVSRWGALIQLPAARRVKHNSLSIHYRDT